MSTRDNQTLPIPGSLQISWRGGDTGVVTWESSDPAIATVSDSGFVVARFPGAATITARRGTASATLSLKAVASRIDVTPSQAFIQLDDSVRFTATVRDANG